MIVTERLDLIPGTIPSIEAALAGPAALGTALGVAVPLTWPPEYLDAAAFEFTGSQRLHRHPGPAGHRGNLTPSWSARSVY